MTARFVRLQLRGASPVCVGELRVLGESASAPRAIGHDLSFAVQEAAIGNDYTDRGAKALPERILADHGANFARLRLWLAPPGGYSNLASVLAMAARAHAAGMPILLDLHYSDFWADPATQNTPAAWQGQDLATLATTVRTYTRDVLTALAAQGTPAAMVQIGNEIRNGGHPRRPARLCLRSHLGARGRPQGRGAGVFYWQPEWITGVGWTPGAGTPNDNLTMFNFTGQALPSVQFVDPLQACRDFAPGQLPCTF